MNLGRALLAVMASIAALTATGSVPVTTSAQAAVRDWTRTVVATPAGGFRMGNPNAAVKLVEYGSLTCPHCARFSADASSDLVQNYVRTGKVSYEFRNFVRDPYDLAAALLSSCAGPSGFFAMTHEILATQDQWTGRFGALSASEYDALQALPDQARLVRIANIAGLDALAAKHGVPASRARACLADPKATTRIAAIRKMAIDQDGLQGTPTFLINGRKVEHTTWASLEPLLGRPGG
jgi:protein-disulfide isomerase